MKTLNYLTIAFIGLALVSCGQNSTKNDKADNTEQSQSQTEENSLKNNEKVESKFLISKNSVGYFTIDSAWQNIAKKDYDYKYVQAYGTCIDACCDGGYTLGNKIIDSEYGKIIENPELTIGAMSFDKSESKNKHKSNPNVFYASSDNCNGWYWKDKISYIIIHSDLFKTIEGIGVGTTLEVLQEKFGEIHFDIGWIEEDANAVQIKIKSYPNIQFIIDADSYKGKGNENKKTVSISDFEKNSKIKRIIVHAIKK